MARATYLAPGVYVEEVPSAQQPIAGVGTNTAAFIGIIPDEIQFPVRNEDYDPQEALKALEPPEVAQGETSALEQEARNAEQGRATAQQELEAIEEQLKADDLQPRREQTLKRQRDAKAQQVADLTQQANERREQLRAMRSPPQIDQSVLRPYTLESFSVEVEPCATKLCTNFSEYTRRFGPFSADDPDNPGQPMYEGHRALTHAVNGFFRNGGTRCFVARIKGPSDLARALRACESIDAVAIIACPGMSGRGVWQELGAHCEKMEDRFAILDSPEIVGSESEFDVKQLEYGGDPSDVLPQRNRNAAYYQPWIWVMDPAKQLQDSDPARRVPLPHRGSVCVSPTGHMAGIYARTDEERGVHKAPANAAVLGALDVRYFIGRPRQELLNPQGVNCIRNLNGNVTVWGARTIGGDKNGEWKYINVRRLFLYLRESIDEGTQWVVFEPNDQALWGKIRRNVGAFLTNVWRSGALFGSTPQEAFYVKCDAETNPLEVRELGQVITEIGVAIVRPAEFVIFRVTQWGGPGSS